jgi:hypothetical protein
MATSTEWAKAFARQALADFTTWDALQSVSVVPACHKLLFLQMACEKLTKAHLWHQGSDPQQIQNSHAYTAKNLPTIVKTTMIQLGSSAKTIREVLRHVKHLAQEIELLSPSVDRNDQRRDNCEYPWEEQDGSVLSPLDWSFQPSRLLMEPAGRTFLKIVRQAIKQLA